MAAAQSDIQEGRTDIQEGRILEKLENCLAFLKSSASLDTDFFISYSEVGPAALRRLFDGLQWQYQEEWSGMNVLQKKQFATEVAVQLQALHGTVHEFYQEKIASGGAGIAAALMGTGLTIAARRSDEVPFFPIGLIFLIALSMLLTAGFTHIGLKLLLSGICTAENSLNRELLDLAKKINTWVDALNELSSPETLRLLTESDNEEVSIQATSFADRMIIRHPTPADRQGVRLELALLQIFAPSR